MKLSVSETRFNAWPAAVRKLFEPARTVRHGKPTYEITEKKGDM